MYWHTGIIKKINEWKYCVFVINEIKVSLV